MTTENRLFGARICLWLWMLVFCTGCDDETTRDHYSFDTPIKNLVVRVIGMDPVDIEIAGVEGTESTVDITLVHEKARVPFEAGIAEQAYGHEAVADAQTLVVALEMKDGIFCKNGRITVALPPAVNVFIDTYNDGNISVHNIQGRTVIQNKTYWLYGVNEISVVGTTGDLDIFATWVSQIHLKRVDGSVSVSANLAGMTMDAVTGNVDMDLQMAGGVLKGTQIRANTFLLGNTGIGEIDVALTNDFQLLDVTSMAGNIVLRVPAFTSSSSSSPSFSWAIDTYAPKGKVQCPNDISDTDSATGVINVRALSGNITVQTE